jgi:hypothetical protein
MSQSLYNDKFFEAHERDARESARAMLPLLFEFVRPASVVDFGCGWGTWLVEFQAAGVTEYLGLDGDYVDRAKLHIEPARFLARDLTRLVELERRFEMAVCLEVAEHLRPEFAETLVASLVRAAPLVLFSGAIPLQHGTGHYNEQWPEYWQEIFRRHDYVVVDCLRRAMWNDRRIGSWYRQNTLLFVQRSRLEAYPRLKAAYEQAGPNPPLSLVHPEFYLQHYLSLVSQWRSTQCQAVRRALRLRELVLVAFPDWSLPGQLVRAQICHLLAVLAQRADRGQVSLVVHSGSPAQSADAEWVKQWCAEMPPDLGALLAEGPGVCPIPDSFNRTDWDILLDGAEWRVSLSPENRAAILACGAEQFPAISLDRIQTEQSLARVRMAGCGFRGYPPPPKLSTSTTVERTTT